MLILKRPWTRQPQTVWPLRDRWRGVAVSPISGIGRAFTADGQSQITTVGSVTTGAGAGGLRSSHVTGGPNMLRAQIPGSTIGTDENGAAFLLQFSTTSTAASRYIAGFGSDSGSSGNTLFSILQAATPSQIRVTVGNSNSNPGLDVTAASVVNNGRVVTALVSLNNFNTSGSCTYQAYVDGNVYVEQTDAAQTGNANIYNWICAGSLRRTTDLDLGPTCQIYLAVGFKRRLTVAEGQALTRNPWQELFEPQQIIIPTPAAAGYTHPTLSLATATEIGATSFKPSVTYTF